MKDQALFQALRRLEPPFPDELGEEVNVVIHLPGPVELGILVLEAVVAVGAGGDDLLDAVEGQASRGTLQIIQNIVQLACKSVDIFPVKRRDEGLVELVNQGVGSLVA
jgi:hypothetical protein